MTLVTTCNSTKTSRQHVVHQSACSTSAMGLDPFTSRNLTSRLSWGASLASAPFTFGGNLLFV